MNSFLQSHRKQSAAAIRNSPPRLLQAPTTPLVSADLATTSSTSRSPGVSAAAARLRKQHKPFPLGRFEDFAPKPAPLDDTMAAGSLDDPLVIVSSDEELPDLKTALSAKSLRTAASTGKRKRRVPKREPTNSDSDVEIIATDSDPETRSPISKKRKPLTPRINKGKAKARSKTASGGHQQELKTSDEDTTSTSGSESDDEEARPGEIKITRRTRILALKDFDAIPLPTWTVPMEPTAYILDYSSIAIPTSVSGIDHLIRNETQDTWAVKSRGSPGSDVWIKKGILSDKKVRARRIHCVCNGVRICTFFPRDDWAGLERYEPEMDKTRELGQEWLKATAEENKRLQPQEHAYVFYFLVWHVF